MAVVRRIPCVISRVTDHGERVYTVELKPSKAVPSFHPGQFLHLAIDPYDGVGFWPESRVFSIASSPRERDQLTITYAVKGAFTTRMERELVPGAVVWVKLPYGEFAVDPTSDAVLFAGGTGVTAFTAFLQLLTPDAPNRVLLFYGARTSDLFIYGPLVQACAAEVPSLTCTLVCEETQGRLAVDAAWPTIEPLDNPIFYLSGPPQMLTALSAQLHEQGATSEAIRIDAWE
jgi:CDP-4-dehydro-6-deoxyglucose reductase/3-phenylpropionate/trans-cinnamate dioxygenase ferredoxin reductase subunit